MTLAERPRSFKLGPQHWIVAVLLALLLHGLALLFLYPPDPAKAKPRAPKFEISLKPAPSKKAPKKKARVAAKPAPEPKAPTKPPKPQPKSKAPGSAAPTGEKSTDEKKAAVRKDPSPTPAPAAEPKSAEKTPPPPKAAPQAKLPPAPARTGPSLPKTKPKPAEPKKRATPAKPRPKAKKKPLLPRQSASRPTKPPVRAKRSQRPSAKPGGRRPRGGPAGVVPNYVAKVQAWLRAHKNYPEVARRQGIQGRVVIQFVMNRRGHVLSHRIVRSSGHQVLDVAAELTLLESAPLPPMPRQMKQKRIRLTYAIQYF